MLTNSSMQIYVQNFYNHLENTSSAEVLYRELIQIKEAILDENNSVETPKDATSYLSENTLAFFDGLNEEDYPSAIDDFIQIYQEDTKPLNVTVTSAIPLKTEQRNRIIKVFRKKVDNHHLFIKEVVDPAVLGGVRLETTNFYFDNTLLSKLNEMRKHILEDQ